MSESLYFNLLFFELSDSFGNINKETLQILSKTYSGNDINQVTDLYHQWRRNPQRWCFKPSVFSEKQVSQVAATNCKCGSKKSEETAEGADDQWSVEDPVMVIHVCDEPKNLNRDFFCSKKLLMREMKYFTDYLSGENPNIEDVDISVHCDVNIFEWLMKYVKRHQMAETERVSVANLKPNNVISILISSDFLKMDSLVDECIEFIFENINSLLMSSNINCLNASLIVRISEKFTDIEIDKIVDKKDKIKSALYKNKIECLFDGQLSKKLFTIAPATSLFKCKFCERILIRNFEQHIKCDDSRLCVDSGGSIIYCHEVNESWKIDDQLLEWVQHFRTKNSSIIDATSMLYWRLWAYLNIVQCEKCKEIFPLYEIGHCQYHPEAPRYSKDDGRSVIPITEGMYLCCGLKTLRFDPFQVNKGCKSKDHIIQLYTNGIKYNDEAGHLDKILDVVRTHRPSFEVPFVRPSYENDFITNIIGRDRLIIRSKFSDFCLKCNDEADLEANNENSCRPRLQPLIRLRSLRRSKKFRNNLASQVDDMEEDVGESDFIDKDEIGFNNLNTIDSPITVKAGAILLDAPQFPVFKNKKWDSNKSMRYNQDSQRQEDLRRMRQIVQYLTGLRVEIDKNPKPKSKEFSGGIYCKLDQQWRTELSEKIALTNLLTQRALSGLKTKQKSSPGIQPFK